MSSTRYANNIEYSDGIIGGIGSRINQLKDRVRGKTLGSNTAGQSIQSPASKRSAGSLYEVRNRAICMHDQKLNIHFCHQLVNSSPASLYDARTSLDKICLTSTRFVNGKASSPQAVFSQIEQRQHILVTGGFSSVGKSLVRDLLLLRVIRS
jgi:hypothetical protein